MVKKRLAKHEYNQTDWEYETKCRRCNTLTFWHFMSRKDLDWMVFGKSMNDYLTKPRMHRCSKCERETIQDVVSYTLPHDKV